MALKLKGSTSGFVGLDAPAVAGNNTLILPDSAGSAHQILANDITAGVTTFTQVTISRNGDLTVPGTISIGGTLTYEDVTSVDSVGIVTARSGVRINGGGLTIIGDTTGLKATGISTFVDVSARNLTVSAASTFTGNIKQTAPGSSTAKLTLNNESDTTGMDVGYSESSGAGFINVGQSGSGLSIKTGGTAAGNERLSITSAGKVGISSASPTSLLTVGGGPNSARSSHPTALISPTSGNASLMLRGSSPTIDFDSTGGGNAQVCTDNSDLIVSAGTFENTALNAGEMVRIKSNGAVGIGTVPETNANLHIMGAARGRVIVHAGGSESAQLWLRNPKRTWKIHNYYDQDSLIFTDDSDTRLTINAQGDSTFAGIVTATEFVPTVAPLANRNKVINGGMVISQRNGTSSVQLSASEVYMVDRFKSDNGSSFDMKADATQVADHPIGFAKALKLQCDGVSTPSGSHNGGLSTFLEGQDVQDFGFGTSGAKPVTVSFYAKTATQNSGDTYGLMVGFYGESNGRQRQTRSFTVTDAWQRFEFTFQPNGTAQSDPIVNTNAHGFQIFWSLAAGSTDAVAEETTWNNTSSLVGVSGQSNFFDQVNNQFFLTGVQLEIGNKATPFEHRSFEHDMIKCMRYCQKIFNAQCIGTMNTSSRMRIMANFTVPMRGTPSYTRTSNVLSFQKAASNATSSNTTEAQGGATATADGNSYARTWDFGGFSSLADRTFIGGNGGHTFTLDAEL